jgi:hypothetical protein
MEKPFLSRIFVPHFGKLKKQTYEKGISWN